MFTRREICGLVPALMATGVGFADVAAGRSDVMLPSKIYEFQQLPVHQASDHASRPVFDGETHAGVPIELHETELAPGGMPHPSHHHVSEEIFMVRDGLLEVVIDGKSSRIGAGSVAYIASNVEHSIRNVGKEAARYFVLKVDAPRVHTAGMGTR